MRAWSNTPERGCPQAQHFRLGKRAETYPHLHHMAPAAAGDSRVPRWWRPGHMGTLHTHA